MEGNDEIEIDGPSEQIACCREWLPIRFRFLRKNQGKRNQFELFLL